MGVALILSTCVSFISLTLYHPSVTHLYAHTMIAAVTLTVIISFILIAGVIVGRRNGLDNQEGSADSHCEDIERQSVENNDDLCDQLYEQDNAINHLVEQEAQRVEWETRKLLIQNEVGHLLKTFNPSLT